MESKSPKHKSKSYRLLNARTTLPILKVNVENYFEVTNNTQCQFGNRNSMTLPADTMHLLERPKDFEFSKNDVALGLVNAVLCSDNGQPAPMELTVLDNKVQQQLSLLKPESKLTFKNISGLPMHLFIDRNKNWYEKYENKRKIMVKLLPKKIFENKPLKIRGQRTSSESEVLSVGTEDQSDMEYVTATELTDAETPASDLENPLLSYEAEEETDDQNACSSSFDSKSSEKQFKVVRRKRSKRKTHDEGKISSNVSRIECIQKCEYLKRKETDNPERSELLLESLLGKQENPELLIRNIKKYIAKPFEFLLDIVSAWNTPDRYKTIIVLHNKSTSTIEQLTGIQKDDILNLNNILKEQSYKATYLPCFEYIEVKFKGIIHLMLEIPKNKDFTMPIVIEHRDETGMSSGQLWCREGSERIKLSFDHPSIGRIYEWFQKRQTIPAACSVERYGPKSSGSSSEKQKWPWNKDIVYQTSPDEFLNVMHKFKKGHFSLLSGDVKYPAPNLNAFAKLPFISVYDFDVNGRDAGLLNANEDEMSRQRSLHVTTWKDAPPAISENATLWTFLRGRRDDPQSRMKNENDVRHWYKSVSSRLQNYTEQLQRFINGYTILTLLILWPENEDLISFMCRFISTCIGECLEPSPKLVLCIPSEPKTETGRSYLNTLWREWSENLTIFQLPIKQICECIETVTGNTPETRHIEYTLPSADECLTPKLSDKEASWLKEDMEVLYLENPYTKALRDVEALSEERHQFYRGGTMHWFAWYECGNDRFDVERDLRKTVVSKINACIDNNKSEIITLYHAPGSGGTTLAQRVLWEFHDKIPSAHIKLRTASPVVDLVDRVKLLHEKSHTPVLLLIDGEEESRVRHLMQLLKARTITIILYVKQYPYLIKEDHLRTKVWLKSTVSQTEAKNLALKYGDRCGDDNEKKKKLNQLSKDVERHNPHFLYEFGLTAFTFDFKGVEAYVKGYLRLHENQLGELKDWQKIMAYLSLVYFYGQASLPCQFFMPLLHVREDTIVTIEDFKYPITDFIVVDKNENRKGNIRICHHIIAQEILQQILGDRDEKYERGPNLSPVAKTRLSKLCIEFIEYASKRKQKTCGTIAHILARTFIFRDNKEICENAEQGRRKPRLSRIIIDITSKQPLFTERLSVLQKLTEAFPEDPNFIAHLGRFYAYCRPDDQTNAEECLQKALDLVNQQTKGKNLDELDERYKLSLMHIYHMYGTILQKRIAMYTGQTFDDKPLKHTKKGDIVERLEQLLPLAERSCKYFRDCRDCTPSGRENCYGYVGEISVRLQICDFIEKYFEVDGHKGIKGLLIPTQDKDWPGKEFVRTSISIVDNLLMECYNVIDQEDMDPAIQRYVYWYNLLFHRNSIKVDDLSKGDDLAAYRLKIAVTKLKHKERNKDYTILENIQNSKDIEDIVTMYEEIFRKIPIDSPVESKRALDRDYQEWLYAIRHYRFPKTYTVENVLLTVQQWEDQLKTPMSKFYMFILTSLLGFGTKKESGKTECLIEAQRMIKDDMQKAGKFLLKPKYPREWLGKDETGIKRLVTGTRFLGLSMNDRDTKGLIQSDLAICRGTISHPNKQRGAGFITLDLGDNLVPVTIFYIPNVCGLTGSHYAGKRVEFVIGFTVENGYEAFYVKLLEKYGCTNPNCCGTVEIPQNENSANCRMCRKQVVKTDMNQVAQD